MNTFKKITQQKLKCRCLHSISPEAQPATSASERLFSSAVKGEEQPDLHLLSPLSVLRCPSRKSFFPNGKNLSTISYLIRGAGPRSQFTSYDSPACQPVRAPLLGLRHSLGITFFFFFFKLHSFPLVTS